MYGRENDIDVIELKELTTRVRRMLGIGVFHMAYYLFYYYMIVVDAGVMTRTVYKAYRIVPNLKITNIISIVSTIIVIAYMFIYILSRGWKRRVDEQLDYGERISITLPLIAIGLLALGLMLNISTVSFAAIGYISVFFTAYIIYTIVRFIVRAYYYNRELLY